MLLGGEKVGNVDGFILVWNGGLILVFVGYIEGDFYFDLYVGEVLLFMIIGVNYKEYVEFLFDGLIKMFEIYFDLFKLFVYKMYCLVFNFQFVYDVIKVNVICVELLDGGNGMLGVVVGILFFILVNGLEVIWNYIVCYCGQVVQCNGGQVVVIVGGDYNVIGFDEQLLI